MGKIKWESTMAEKRVIGQNHINKHFENAIKMDKISHAYIINGEKGTGKRALAAEFAKSLQCQDVNSIKTGRACDSCRSCSQSDSENQPDIKWITYEKTGIGVDEIRDQINNDIVIKPYSSKYKVYIIPDGEKMTIQAQNALLKTIEEPPEYAIIIILTTNSDRFLPTILSRCMVLNIRPVKDSIIKKMLMYEYGVGDYAATTATTFAEGNPGKAIMLSTSEEFSDLKNAVVNTLTDLENCGMDRVSQNIKVLSGFKAQIAEYFSLTRTWFRDMLLYKAEKDSELLIFQDHYKVIERQSLKLSYSDINNILDGIDQAEGRIDSNVNFDMTIEVLFLLIKERMQK